MTSEENHRRIARLSTRDGSTGPAPGDVVADRYLLRREIARGGMAIVFEAEQRFTGRAVGLKILLAGHARVPAIQERLLREARVLGAVFHPHVVEALDAGRLLDGTPYLAMEMLEGRTLEGFLTARGTLPVADVVEVARQLCEALSFVHTLGVVHRDVKPSNVMIVRDRVGRETVKLIDFGVAAMTSAPSDGSAPAPRLTVDGGLVGTMGYMALEQLLAEAVDARADVFALGVTLYECLTGDLPHGGDIGEVVRALAMSATIPSIRAKRKDVSAALEAVIMRALASSAGARWPSMASFAEALRAASGSAPGETALLGLGLSASPNDARLPVPTIPTARASEPPPLLLQRRRAPVGELQKRRHERAPYVTPLIVSREPSEALTGRCEEISESGMLMIVDGTFVVGEWAMVQFSAPVIGEIVEIGMIVRRVREHRGRSSCGLEFVDPPAHVQAAIRRYVELGGAIQRAFDPG
ncbi:MAG: serine/threonine-protein kinase [Deltaproteobacteria bacterium]